MGIVDHVEVLASVLFEALKPKNIERGLAALERIADAQEKQAEELRKIRILKETGSANYD